MNTGLDVKAFDKHLSEEDKLLLYLLSCRGHTVFGLAAASKKEEAVNVLRVCEEEEESYQNTQPFLASFQRFKRSSQNSDLLS